MEGNKENTFISTFFLIANLTRNLQVCGILQRAADQLSGPDVTMASAMGCAVSGGKRFIPWRRTVSSSQERRGPTTQKNT